MARSDAARPTLCVFAPAPIVTVAIERRPDGGDEIHVHAGGQGWWIARLAADLGIETVLCITAGGEMGSLVRGLGSRTGMRIEALEVSSPNGGYVHDRRGGERVELAAMPDGRLTRHEVDDFYGLALKEGLAATATVLTGPQDDHVLPADVYRRLARDLRANGCRVVADLSGPRLEAALRGGLDLLKVSEDELRDDGRLARTGSLPSAVAELHQAGAAAVVVTLGERGALASVDGELWHLRAPEVEAVDAKGAGDSFTAATVAALLSGVPMVEALRWGVAAGATNVTRRGLASGQRDVIEALTARVSVVAAEPPTEGTEERRSEHEGADHQ